MLTDMEKRPYKLRKRAQSQQQTRRRIIEALVALHEEVGPRNTTISAIAERAGVQRLTVYRHFPDEAALLQACTSHWLELNPPPDPEHWRTIDDGVERTRAALRALYQYFRSTERMWRVSFRDESEVPALQGPMKAFRAYLEAIADDLLQALTAVETAQPQLVATSRHAVQFHTWVSLAEQGLGDPQAAALVTRWLQAAQAPDGVETSEARPQAGGGARDIAALSVVLRDAAGAPVLEGTAPLRPAARNGGANS